MRIETGDIGIADRGFAGQCSICRTRGKIGSGQTRMSLVGRVEVEFRLSLPRAGKRKSCRYHERVVGVAGSCIGFRNAKIVTTIGSDSVAVRKLSS